MNSRFEVTKSISLPSALSPTRPARGPGAHLTPTAGGGRDQVKCLKHACPVLCPKFPSEGAVAAAGVMTLH